MFYSLKLFYIPEAKASHLPLLYILFRGDGNQQGCVAFAVDKAVNIFFIFFLPVDTGDFRGNL